MSLSGARGLNRVAHNPTCELQAAMVIGRVREPEMYQALAGADYPGEYGERTSARRRGTQFENALFRDDARLLRETLAPVLGTPWEGLSVRNLVGEVRGESAAAMAERHRRTRSVFDDMVGGRPVPDVLIQPQLQLSTGRNQAMYIAPDALALDRERRVYTPVEIKSFIVRDGVVDPADRDSARRQAAVELIALGQELAACGVGEDSGEMALFIFATPFGFRPHPAFAERLSAELYEMRRAVAAIEAVRIRLEALGVQGPLDVQALARIGPQLTTTYQESCVAGCLLAALCRQRQTDQVIVLGDAAANVLGGDITLSRTVELLQGAAPQTPREIRLTPALRDAAAIFGWPATGTFA